MAGFTDRLPAWMRGLRTTDLVTLALALALGVGVTPLLSAVVLAAYLVYRGRGLKRAGQYR